MIVDIGGTRIIACYGVKVLYKNWKEVIYSPHKIKHLILDESSIVAVVIVADDQDRGV